MCRSNWRAPAPRKKAHGLESRCRRQRVEFLDGGQQPSSGRAAHLPHLHELEVSMAFSRCPAVKSEVACGSTDLFDPTRSSVQRQMNGSS